MGDRALVVFHDGEDYSPTTYLHWSGNAVPQLLTAWWEAMEGRRGDLSYGAARFVGLCHEHIAGPLSLGIFNTRGRPVSMDFDDDSHLNHWNEQTHGDAGVFVVNVGTGKVVTTGGYSQPMQLGAKS